MWLYLLHGEIARAAAEAITSRPADPVPGTPDWRLVEYVRDPANGLDGEFAIRLEHAVERADAVEVAGSFAQHRERLARSLYAEQIAELTKYVADALPGDRRLCVLVDNLDKAWDKSGDLDELAHLLLGLFEAVGLIEKNFSDYRGRREEVSISLALFIRSDIYAHIARVAREPDKLPVERLEWEPELLLRVLEERFLDGRNDASADQLWSQYFAPDVEGVPVRNYLVQRTLPRPRDVVQLCNAAVISAVNSRHQKIEVSDITAGERVYSQVAVEALLVENASIIPDLEEVIYEFVGAKASLDVVEVERLVASASSSLPNTVIERLQELSFLGLETSEGKFKYSEIPAERRKAAVLARRLEKRLGRPARLQVHPAYRTYLEIDEGATMGAS